ncbi:MAG TPA: DUF1592 domain-containing protein [Cellvibrionaceae bacterium]
MDSTTSSFNVSVVRRSINALMMSAVLALLLGGCSGETSTSSSSSSSSSSNSSSSSGSSWSQPGNPALGEIAYGQQCSGCHGKQGSSDINPRALKVAAANANLAKYIHDNMPVGKPTNCVNDCAANTAAYINSWVVSGSSSSSSSSGSSGSLDGKALFSSKCAKCHGANGEGIVDVAPALNKETFSESYLLTKIPSMPSSCSGDCASAVAKFIRATFTPAQNVCNGSETPLPKQLRLLTRTEYRNTVNDLFNITSAVAESLPITDPVGGYDNNAHASAVSESHMGKYWDAAGALADTVNISSINTCNQKTTACATTIVDSFGAKAFRRPLTSAERADYVDLFMYASDAAKGTRYLIRAFLSSPNFLYRSELGNNGTLTPYETASLLSYTFWGSLPDATLTTAAANNQLSTPAQLRTQATRLLADAKAKRHMAYFARQWLGAQQVVDINKDLNIFPQLTTSLRSAIDTEFDMFIQDLFFNSNSKFADIYLANYTYANSTLAQFYGLSGASSSFSKINAGSQRGGVLDMAAVLSSHAQFNQTSPIKRGKFVRERLLCQELPPPPAGLNAKPPALDPSKPTRDRFAAHTSDPSCQNCHQFIDPIGFSFERYDAIGAYRTTENDRSVDESGSLRGLINRTDTDVTDYTGTQDLAQILATSTSGSSCLAKQFEVYVTGTAQPDQCTVQNVVSRWSNKAYVLPELWLEAVSSESFLKRN